MGPGSKVKEISACFYHSPLATIRRRLVEQALADWMYQRFFAKIGYIQKNPDVGPVRSTSGSIS